MRTLAEIDKQVEDRLAAYGRPMVSFNETGLAGGYQQTQWWAITKDLSKDELPAMFLAGGRRYLTVTEAETWLKEFVRKNPERFKVEVE